MNKKIVLIIGLLILLLGIFIFTNSEENSGNNYPHDRKNMRRENSNLANTTAVRLESIKKDSFHIDLKSLGTVSAYNTVNVTPKIPGQIIEIFFSEGQFVEKEQILAKIDDFTYQNAFKQANASYEDSKAQINNAQMDLNRYQKLFNENSVAKQTLDAAKTKVEQLKNVVINSLTNIANATKNLEDTEIKAPISGVIGLKQIDVGNYISSSQILTSITTVDPIAVLFSINDEYITDLRQEMNKGKVIQIEAWNKNDTKLIATGILESMDNKIDPNTGTIKIRAKFDNKEQILFPNQFVNVKFTLKSIEDAVIAPNSAIAYGSKGPFVYIVKDNIVEIKNIKLGSSSFDKVLVVEGLNGDEKVVIEGMDRLRNNSKVEIVSIDGENIE